LGQNRREFKSNLKESNLIKVLTMIGRVMRWRGFVAAAQRTMAAKRGARPIWLAHGDFWKQKFHHDRQLPAAVLPESRIAGRNQPYPDVF
jgi:hypothetical protein